MAQVATEAPIHGFATTIEEPPFQTIEDEDGRIRHVFSWKALQLADKPGGLELIAGLIKARHGPQSDEVVDETLAHIMEMRTLAPGEIDIRKKPDGPDALTILAELDNRLTRRATIPNHPLSLSELLKKARE